MDMDLYAIYVEKYLQKEKEKEDLKAICILRCFEFYWFTLSQPMYKWIVNNYKYIASNLIILNY